jgi:hydrogenase maturation protease
VTAPVLLVGLGNTLAGDDGVGARIVAALARDPRLPAGVEAVQGGSDLLRLAACMAGRGHVVLVDALLDPAGTGRVSVRTDESGFDTSQPHAHHLSAVQAMGLLRVVVPGLAELRTTWVGVHVAGARVSRDLSPGLQALLPEITDAVLAVVQQAAA